MALVTMYIIGGFLGSGKTTFLQHLLDSQSDLASTAVLVNEFGEISVDGMLLDLKGSQLVELASGCICCSMKGEFIKSLEDVLNTFTLTRIFVETTGVADTLELITVLKDSKVSHQVALKKIICILDADLWPGRDNFGLVFFNQIKAADLILLNKVDLIEKGQVVSFMEEIQKINPNSLVIPTYYCKIDLDLLLEGEEKEGFLHLDKLPRRSDLGLKLEKPMGFMTFLFREEGCLSEACFKEFLSRVPPHIFRIKGKVRFLEGTFLLNHVGGRSQWKESEKATGSKMVFIGWDMDIEALKSDLAACRENRWS